MSSTKVDIPMNTATLTTMETTVVRYFTLARFKFLYAILPPIPKNLLTQAGQRSPLDISFIRMVSFPRIALIGEIRAARLAEPEAEKYTVTADITAPSRMAGKEPWNPS